MKQRMKSGRMGIVLAGIAVLAGCIPVCLQPLFEKEEQVFEERLLGSWQDKNQGETWVFTKASDPDNGYTVVYYEPKKEENVTPRAGQFQGILGRIGGVYVLNLLPDAEMLDLDDPNFPGSGYYWLHYLPVWGFLKVEFGPEGALALTQMNLEWLEKHLQEKSEDAAHQQVSERLVLTGTGKEMQAFLGKYLNDENAFKNETVLHRVEQIPADTTKPIAPETTTAKEEKDKTEPHP